MEKLKNWVKRKAPRWVFNIVVKMWDTYKKLRMPEQKKSFGSLNPDVTFYVIRLYPPATGFLADYQYFLGYMMYAKKKGWIPVIDMENYETMYYEEDGFNGTKNVWEYFFEQPFDEKTGRRYSLEEVYKSKNVVLSCGADNTMYDDVLTMKEDVLQKRCEMTKLIPFNSYMTSYIEDVKKQLDITSSNRLLGLCLRGTDMSTHISGHFAQASVEEIVDNLKSTIKEYSLENIYVKTEEEETLNKVLKYFPEAKYQVCERVRDYDVNKAVNIALVDKKISKAESLRDYLADIAILSECTVLTGGMNNGLLTAIIWNENNYEKLDVIDKGRW